MADLIGGSVVWNLDADNAKFNQQLDKASESIHGLKGKLQQAEGASKAFAASIAVIGAAVVGFGVKSFQAYNMATEAQTKLSTNLLNVKGNTDKNVESLSRLASKLQSIGVIEDDVIKAGMSQLATFNLQGSTIEKLTPKITDMVAQMKGHNATAEDMVGINNLVGKVMTGNVGALSRYGVTLSESQAKLLKQGTETQRASVLTEVLAQNYGKVNEQLRNTPQGQITAFKNTFGDFMEVVGQLVSNGLTPLIKRMNDLMAAAGGPEGMFKKITATITALQPHLPIIVGVIVGGLIPAFSGLAGAIALGTWHLLPFMAAGVLLVGGIKLIVDALGGWDNAMKVVGSGINTIVGIYNATLGPVISMLFDSISKNLVPALSELFRLLSPVLMPVLKTVAVIIGGTLVAALTGAIGVVSIIINGISGLIFMVSGLINAFRGIDGAIRSAMSGVYNALVGPFRSAFDWIKNAINDVVSKMRNLSPFTRHSPSLVDNVVRGVGIIKDEYMSLNKMNIAPELAMSSPMGVLSPQDFGGSSMSTNQDINIYIDKVNDKQDVDALGRELGFRASLNK